MISRVIRTVGGIPAMTEMMDRTLLNTMIIKRERLDLKFNESTGRLYQVEMNYGMNRSRYDD